MSGHLTIPLSDICRALKGYVAQMQSEKNSPEVLIIFMALIDLTVSFNEAGVKKILIHEVLR